MPRRVLFQTPKGEKYVDLDRVTELRRGIHGATILRADGADIEVVARWNNVLEDLYQAINGGSSSSTNELSSHTGNDNPFEDQGERGFVPPDEQDF